MAYFSNWIEGFRPEVQGDVVIWEETAEIDSSYRNFRRYLECVMTYAGTHSLSKEMERVSDISDMQIGDVFIQGGFPGHAVLVVDMAFSEGTGWKLFLLVQSFMPAQDLHILKNPDGRFSPWYELDFGEILHTPEWTFTKEDLYRFR